jgi:hypothetical protein
MPGTDKGLRVREAFTAPSTTNFRDHGGVVISNPKVYVIWYGDWGTDSARQLLPAFIRSLGSSPWWRINHEYKDSKEHIAGQTLSLAGEHVYAVAPGETLNTSLSDTDVWPIVVHEIERGNLPNDASGIYLVLGASNIDQTNYCGPAPAGQCGWHSWVTTTLAAGPSKGMSSHIRYAYIANAAGRSPACARCGANDPSPHQNPGADAMASVIAHELTETVTDPDFDAWRGDSNSEEDGDLCAWQFGTTRKSSNGADWNVCVGGSPWLIQQNWSKTDPAQCALFPPTETDPGGTCPCGGLHQSCCGKSGCNANLVCGSKQDESCEAACSICDRTRKPGPCGVCESCSKPHVCVEPDVCGQLGSRCCDGGSCEGNLQCSGGTCVSCAANQTLCSGRCVTVGDDAANCGACGRVCTNGMSCVSGNCACPAGETVCNGACTRVMTDAANCGACGHRCPASKHCEAGTCKGSCSADCVKACSICTHFNKPGPCSVCQQCGRDGCKTEPDSDP